MGNKNVVNNTRLMEGARTSQAIDEAIMYIRRVDKEGNKVIFTSNDGDEGAKAELLKGLSKDEKTHLNKIQRTLIGQGG